MESPIRPKPLDHIQHAERMAWKYGLTVLVEIAHPQEHPLALVLWNIGCIFAITSDEPNDDWIETRPGYIGPSIQGLEAAWNARRIHRIAIDRHDDRQAFGIDITEFLDLD